MKIKFGKMVKWVSQSHGTSTQKIGIVRGYIFKGSRNIIMDECEIDVRHFKSSHHGVKFDASVSLQGDRYLVEVERIGENRKPLVSHWYMPRASVVDRENKGWG